MIIVMVAVSSSLILTFAFLRTQSSLLMHRESRVHRDQALHAARTGAAAGIQAMQRSAWNGITESFSSTLEETDTYSVRYEVTYQSVDASAGINQPIERALSLTVRSVGIWHSHTDNRDVRRTVEAIVQLEPRLADSWAIPADQRTLALQSSQPGSGSVNVSPWNHDTTDVAENPDDFDVIQRFAVFGESSSEALRLEPGSRVEGDVWVRRDLRTFRAPEWSDRVRDEVPRSIAVEHVSEGRLAPPHPLTGHLLHEKKLSKSDQETLDELDVESIRTGTRLRSPNWSTRSYNEYQLYAGGPLYAAEEIPSSLRNRTLSPSATNPLGIFICPSSLEIRDAVTIQGTLIVRNTLRLRGNEIMLCACNGRTDDASPAFLRNPQWPRLPAVIAESLVADSEIRATIEGAVVLQDGLIADSSYLESNDSDPVHITGLATATPLEQPFSRIQIHGPTDLGDVLPNRVHAIRLNTETGRSWFPIEAVDAGRNELVVVGEIEQTTPVMYEIRPGRQSYLEIRGPVSGRQHHLQTAPAWKLSQWLWDRIHENWRLQSNLAESAGSTAVTFTAWLADPANVNGWVNGRSIAGLSLEPTCQIIFHRNHYVQLELPLFRPAPAAGDSTGFDGFRWRVSGWRELP